jgi:hypothetical protein
MKRLLLALVVGTAWVSWAAETLPATEGESLTGHRVVLREAMRGHASILIGSFSKDAGAGCAEWAKAIRADAQLKSVTVYQAVMLEQAPGLVRGMIKSALRRQVPAAEQDNFVVLIKDEKLWRSYFEVSDDKDPYVVLMDGSGQTLWHGHGAAGNLETLVRAALR